MSLAQPNPPAALVAGLRRRADPLVRAWAAANRAVWRRPCLQFLRPLGHMVAYYPLLVPIPVLLFAICWNRVLAEYDAFHIVWNPNWWEGALSGFGVAGILASTLVAVFLLNQKRETPPTGLPEPNGVPADAGTCPPAVQGETDHCPLSGSAAADPWAIPPVPQGAYWVLWLVLLGFLVLPAAVPTWFVAANEPHPFRLNTFKPDPNRFAAPTFPEAVEKYGDEDRAAFDAAQARACWSRWGFPLGVLLCVVAFGGSRLARPGPWLDIDRYRWTAAWLVTLFSTYFALMFVAHGLIGRRPPTGDRWAHPATRAVFWALVVFAVAQVGRRAWPGTWKFHTFGAAVTAGVFLFQWDGSAYSPVTAAPVALLALLGMLTGCAALVTSWNYPRRAWVVLAVGAPLTVPFLFSGWQTDYHIPGLEGHYYEGGPEGGPVSLKDYNDIRKGTGAGLLDDRDAIWAAAERLRGSHRPMVVVTVSGGASASAAYTAETLFTLEYQYPGFVDQVRVITGASGGMLGAAYFVAAFHAGPLAEARDVWHNSQKTAADTEAYRAQVQAALARSRADLERDFLGPLVQRWIYLDVPMYFVPRGVRSDGRKVRPDWGTTNDRGLALEQGWQKMRGPGGAAPEGLLHRPFARLRDDEKSGRVPSLIFTPMMIEDGRQLLISNLDLDYMVDSVLPRYDLTPGDWRAEREQALHPASHTALEFYRLFPGAADTFRLSTAVRLNASFPFLSPPAALPTDPPRHLVDAGYFDNYGTLTGTKWLYRNAYQAHELMARDPSDRAELVLLQLRCYEFESETTDWVRADERDERGNVKKGRPAALHSLAAPFAGALASRRANMVYRGDERVSAINQMLDLDGLPKFERVLIECNLGPSLNWTLTPDTMRMLRHDVWERLVEQHSKDPGKDGPRRVRGLADLLQSGVRLPDPRFL